MDNHPSWRGFGSEHITRPEQVFLCRHRFLQRSGEHSTPKSSPKMRVINIRRKVVFDTLARLSRLLIRTSFLFSTFPPQLLICGIYASASGAPISMPFKCAISLSPAFPARQIKRSINKIKVALYVSWRGGWALYYFTAPGVIEC